MAYKKEVIESVKPETKEVKEIKEVKVEIKKENTNAILPSEPVIKE